MENNVKIFVEKNMLHWEAVLFLFETRKLLGFLRSRLQFHVNSGHGKEIIW